MGHFVAFVSAESHRSNVLVHPLDVVSVVDVLDTSVAPPRFQVAEIQMRTGSTHRVKERAATIELTINAWLLDRGVERRMEARDIAEYCPGDCPNRSENGG